MSGTDLLGAVTWPVRTPRLVLRRARPGDATLTFGYRSDAAVAHWLPRRPGSVEEHRERFESPEILPAMVVAELAAPPGSDPEPAVVGDLMVRATPAWAQAEADPALGRVDAELGWVLDPAHGGRGLATEAVRAVVDLCFGPLGLSRVTATCFDQNTGSWRLMERLGMRRERHGVADALHRDGTWHDSLTYALLAQEWAAQAGTGSSVPPGSGTPGPRP